MIVSDCGAIEGIVHHGYANESYAAYAGLNGTSHDSCCSNNQNVIRIPFKNIHPVFLLSFGLGRWYGPKLRPVLHLALGSGRPRWNCAHGVLRLSLVGGHGNALPFTTLLSMSCFPPFYPLVSSPTNLQSLLDQAVTRTLSQKFAVGMGDINLPFAEYSDKDIDTPEHRQMAFEAARQG